MKQILQNLGNGETIIAEVPIPMVRPGTALIRTAASLVSAGTERMVVSFAEKSWVGKARSRPDLVRQVVDKARREGILSTFDSVMNRLEQPMGLGYSSAGTILELGEGLSGFQVGQRVACAGGGYAVHAEYGVIPANLMALLPDSVDFESAAFTTLGAIALHGFRLAETQLGERVAVIGLGLLGLLAIQIAQAAGCLALGIDLDAQRVRLAESLGCQAVQRDLAEAAAQGFTRGKGFDAILICADTPSNDPVTLAGVIAWDRARVIATGAVGLDIPRKVYYEKELQFINSRSYGPGRYDSNYEEAGQDYPAGYVRWTEGRNLEAFVELLASQKVNVRPLISHRFPIESAAQAYELITGKQAVPFLGVILTYPGDAPGSTLGEKITRSKIHGSAENLTAQPGKGAARVALGVLGAGNFVTAVMLPALHNLDGVSLVGIASASGVHAQHAAQRYHFKYCTSDADQILDDPEVNTIVILTRHHLHASHVLAGLARGKHVFCEKPLAVTPAEIEAIAAALNAQEGLRPPLLMVGFNRRFAPLAVEMAKFFASRREPLVAQYRVNAGFLPLNHWLHDAQQGGGRLVGEGCHFIDFLSFLVGSPPVAVTAQALPDAGKYCQDNFVLNFEFTDGSLGTLTYLANGDKGFPKERVEVFCAGSVAVLDDFRSFEAIRDGKRQVSRSRLRQDKGHRAEWQAFTLAILNGGAPPIPYPQLIGDSQAAFSAVEAVRSGMKVAIKGTS